MTAAATGQVVRLQPETCGVLVIDWQEKLAAAMDPEVYPRHLKNALALVQGAALFRVPVVATEQYPQGLGPTVAPLREALAAEGVAAPVIAKKDFSAWAVPEVRAQVQAAAGRTKWIVLGMESHVCVFQTVRDLKEAGFTVFVPRDAVVSRTRDNWKVGVKLCEAVGATATSTEAVLFDWVGRAEGDAFKAVSRLVR
jgi:nicotinamidase-related amidase